MYMYVNSVVSYVFTVTHEGRFNETVRESWNYIFLSTILTVRELEKRDLSYTS